MAQTTADSGSTQHDSAQHTLTFQADGQAKIELPSHALIADATITRDGNDLVLHAPDGTTAVIEGYYTADPAPLLQSSDGAVLTPNLVESFAKSSAEFAANNTANDASPVGAVEEIKGEATVTHANGTVETIVSGTPIYEGDIVETKADGAVNISFIDETTMAISQNARMAIDHYAFDPASENGTTHFSVLRGLFVFTSGLIGREDPDHVKIETPVGSIGIRGTIIAGDINPGGVSNVSVLEGAIVVTNGSMDTTLSHQFETVRLGSYNDPMHALGVVPAAEISTKFASVGTVLPSLFSVIHEAVHEQQSHTPQHDATPSGQTPETHTYEPVQQDVSPQSSNDIINLNDNHGLPSSQTALGYNSTIFDTQNTTVANTAPSAGTATATPALSSTGSSGSVPSGNADTSHLGDTPMLPPSLTSHNDGTTAPATASPPSPPAAPIISYTAVSTLADTAHAGDLVGTVTTNRTDGVSFSLISNPSGYFTLSVVDANTVNVKLTAAGAAALGSTLDVVQLGSFNVQAETSDLQTTSQSITPTVVDANIFRNIESLSHVSFITDLGSNVFGYSVAAVGDVDHNGYRDFYVGMNSPSSSINQTYQFFGDGNYITNGNIAAAGGNPVNNPGTNYPDMETNLAGIGDFNGDGIYDYAIGQSGGYISGLPTGNAYIVSGSTGSLFYPTGSVAVGDQIGYAISGVGDYNNDGYSDVIIGAPGALSGQGQAHLILGQSVSWGGMIPTGVDYNGQTTSNFGAAAKGVGDINGDGYSDFVIGAPGANGGDGYIDIIYGHKNSASGPATTHILGDTGQGFGTEILALGDINGDGYSDFLTAGSGNTGRFTMGNGLSQTEYNLNGSNYDVSGGGAIGDFNADGYDDYVITMADSTHTNMYIVFGQSGSAPSIDLAYLKDPSHAMELTYTGADKTGDMLDITRVGDLNGDGYDDFTIGVPDLNGSSSGNGGVMVVYGRDTGNSQVTSAAGANNQAIVGTVGNDIMRDNGNAGVSFHSGAGQDTIRISNTNFHAIDGGGNTGAALDTLFIDGVNNSLDFRNVNYEQMSGIEQIQFGANNQTVTLSMENIFNLLKTSDGFDNGTDHFSGYLKISANGMNGSHLVLDAAGATGVHTGASASDVDNALESASGTGTSTPTDVSGAGNFDTFKIGGYMLLIDNAITVDVQ